MHICIYTLLCVIIHTHIHIIIYTHMHRIHHRSIFCLKAGSFEMPIRRNPWNRASSVGFDALYIMTTAMLGSTVCLFWSFMHPGLISIQLIADQSCKWTVKACATWLTVEATDDRPSHDSILSEWVLGNLFHWSEQTCDLPCKKLVSTAYW